MALFHFFYCSILFGGNTFLARCWHALSWIYRATDVCHQRSYSLAPLVESVLCQYSCAIKWTINRSLRFVPIFSAFIVPFICLFKKPLAEGTSSFTAKSKNFLQLRWDSQPCLYLGHHPVELFQHSQVPCKNTQSNNVTDPPPPLLLLPIQIRHVGFMETLLCAWQSGSCLGCATVVPVVPVVRSLRLAQDWWPPEGAGPAGRHQTLHWKLSGGY